MNDQTNNIGMTGFLGMATPDIYRNNAFRRLDVFADAGASDIRRQQKRREMAAKLGVVESGTNIWPLSLEESEEGVRAALDVLADPASRYLHEFFWFAATDKDDDALTRLSSGEPELARQHWEMQINDDDRKGSALHNLAVLDHIEALESPEAESGSWNRALSRWRTVINSEPFWTRAEDRALALEDPRLTPETVKEIRAAFPAAILSINARAAVAAAEADDPAAASRHLAVLKDAPFDEEAREQAIRRAIEPYRSRLISTIESAERRWKADSHRGSDIIKDLHQQAAAILQTIDTVLPVGDYTRVSLHDKLADVTLDGQIAYVRKTHDWTGSIELLERALDIAESDAMKDRLKENIGTLEEQREEGNDWYSHEYWELPQPVIDRLETAHDRVLARDYDGALDVLLSMDKSIGETLVRCVGFALSQRGWQFANMAFDAHREPSSRMAKFLAAIGRTGTLSVPTPETPQYSLPACPCCGSSYYSAWVKGTYREQNFWMCRSCSEKDDEEDARKRRTLINELEKGVEYAVLSEEIDPTDPGLKAAVARLCELAEEFDIRIPTDVSRVRNKLSKSKPSAEWQDLTPASAEQCHFCSERPGDPKSSLRVPMAGDIKTVQHIIGSGVSFTYGEVTVPRCRACRSEHLEFPERLSKWQAALAEATADDDFPEEVSAAASAASDLAEARKELAVADRAERDAMDDLRSAQAYGRTCVSCGAKDRYEDGVCRKCDAEWFRLPGMQKGLLTAITTAGVLVAATLSGLFFAPPSVLESIAGPEVATTAAGATALLVSLLLISMRRRLSDRRHAYSIQRLEQIGVEQAAKVQAAKAACESSRAAGTAAATACELAAQERDLADSRLAAVKDAAAARFREVYPEPRLAGDIRPESDWDSAASVMERLGMGWGFGTTIDHSGTPVTDKPDYVEGSVVELATRSVPKSDSARDKLVALSRDSDPETFVACPSCNAKTKAKNIVRHFDRNHADEC